MLQKQMWYEPVRKTLEDLKHLFQENSIDTVIFCCFNKMHLQEMEVVHKIKQKTLR